MADGTISGKRLVITLVVLLGAGLVAYPFVRRRIVDAHARERAAEVARDRARNVAASSSIAP